MNIDKSTWKNCIICGKKIHPLQENSALPLADGPCCVSCHYGTVYPTQMNKGVPSRWAHKRNENGKNISYFAPLDKSAANRLMQQINAHIATLKSM